VTDIYAAHAHDYRKKGYSPLPLPKNRKAPVPNGWTGSEGLFASGPDIQEWCESNPEGNIALRLPRNVIGIDVDDYGMKSGAKSTRDAMTEFGPLPSTGRVTSRYEQDKVSGIRLFRVPEGTVLASQFSSAGLGPDVEIVQFHHRYCVAPGSIHPDTNLPYKWINLDGTEGELPAVADLPELPQAWIDGLQPKTRSERPASDANHAAYDAMDEATQNQVQSYMEKTLGFIYADLEAMKSWPEDYRDERGEGWEEGVRSKTLRLAQFVNADWNTLTTDEVLRDLKKHCPVSSSFPIAQSLSKFVRALPKADPAHYTITPRDDFDLFEGVEDRSRGKGDGGGEPREPVAPKAYGDTQFSIEFDMAGCFRLNEDGKPTGVKPYSTAEKLLDSWPIAKQALTRGRSWWAYRDGVWVPNDEIVRLSLAKSARDHYKTADVAPVEDSLATMVSELVVEPHAEFINFRNGMLEWRTGELHEHAPTYHSTVQIPHSWNATSECPVFDAWLDQRLPADGVKLAWELIAVTLYSGNPIQRAGLLYGVGKSGKSTFLEVVQGLVGKKNYAALSPQGMTKTVFATHSLLGKQSNIVTDIDPTKIAETAIFKQVIASEAIQAQQKNKPEFTFRPFANHLFSANQIPKTADRTSAWTRRFAILRFQHAIGVEVGRIVEHYDRILLKEAEGIIAKAIRILPNLLVQGDFSVVEADQREFEEATDFTSQFWDEAVTVTGESKDFASKAQLAIAFDMWCTSNRRRNPPPFDDLEPHLKDNPLCERKRKRLGGKTTNAVWGYTGVTINDGYRIVQAVDMLMPELGEDPF
jgi:putative DNA primase/helicase